jgi:hypothetical protein
VYSRVQESAEQLRNSEELGIVSEIAEKLRNLSVQLRPTQKLTLYLLWTRTEPLFTGGIWVASFIRLRQGYARNTLLTY